MEEEYQMKVIPVSDFEIQIKSPERALYAAVLLRSYMDVLPGASVERSCRHQAIEWLKPEKVVDRVVDFKTCIEVLELSAAQVQFLTDAAHRMSLFMRGLLTEDDFPPSPRIRIAG
jgi:hypothetical protein